MSKIDKVRAHPASQDRAATPSGPSPKEVSGIAGIPCAEALPRIPTPKMVGAAWDLVDEQRKLTGITKLMPGLGVVEIWQAMYDAGQ